MFIALVFFLLPFTSFSSEIAQRDDDAIFSLNRMREQTSTSKRSTEHAAGVSFHENELPYGFKSYCSLESNLTTDGAHSYILEDCDQLIVRLIGTGNQFSGYWTAQDYNCMTDRDVQWWMTVAGWGTCSFAVVTSDCRSFPIV